MTLIIILLNFLCYFTLSNSQTPAHPPPPDFVLSLTWGPGACDTKPGCLYVPGPVFTINGYWPSSIVSHGAVQAVKFNLMEEKVLEAMMKLFWPSFYGNNHDFWGSQWFRHGVVANLSGGMDGYFVKTLSLYSDLRITRRLYEQGFEPGDNNINELEYMMDRVAAELGVTQKQSGVPERLMTRLICVTKIRPGENKPKPHLTEVQFCFDKNHQIMNCNSRDSSCYIPGPNSATTTVYV